MVNGNTKIIYAVHILYTLLVLPTELVAFKLAVGNFKKKWMK